MITTSIFWALVLVLFGFNVEQPNERKNGSAYEISERIAKVVSRAPALA